jgi:hypothetical protein
METESSQPGRRVRRLSIAAAAAILAAFCFTYYWNTLRPLPFDSGQWKSARTAHRYDVCYRMSASLVQQLSRKTITGNEVIQLLGEPDSYGGHQWRYHLRNTSALFFPDDYWLFMLVVPDGPVTVVRVIQG